MWRFGRRKESGFTIVELLIVIVVIAILAAITIVAYNGIQARAADSRMQAGVNQIEKALKMWYSQKSQLLRGGLGSTVAMSNGNCSDGEGGWVATGLYLCSYEDLLVAEKLLPVGFTKSLPPNKAYGGFNDGSVSIMLYPCTGSPAGRYALYWYLNNPSTENTASLTTAESAGCPSSPRTTYGMKAARVITLGA